MFACNIFSGSVYIFRFPCNPCFRCILHIIFAHILYIFYILRILYVGLPQHAFHLAFHRHFHHVMRSYHARHRAFPDGTHTMQSVYGFFMCLLSLCVSMAVLLKQQRQVLQSNGVNHTNPFLNGCPIEAAAMGVTIKQY